MSRRIHFGAARAEDAPSDDREDDRGEDRDLMEVAMVVEEEHLDEKQQQMLAEVERKRRMRALVVPTNDAHVRLFLRELLHEPVTLFGEGPYERRERLRELLAAAPDDVRTVAMQLTSADDKAGLLPGNEDSDSDNDDDNEFFSPASADLVHARRSIARFSLPRTRRRILAQRTEAARSIIEAKTMRKAIYENARRVDLVATQVAADRPLSFCCFHPKAPVLLTACFGGSLSLFSIPDCTLTHRFQGHVERVGGMAWHPHALLDQSTVHFASGDATGAVCLWSVHQSTPISSLEGHPLRVSRVAFHPCGQYLGTTSFDTSWRLWDIETSTELLLQEGHSRPVYAIDFQWDGSLAVTAGLDGFGRVWDLRTGRNIMLLEGHVQPVLAASFSPSGYEIVTGGEDNTVRVHDVRMLKSSVAIIPAHKNAVSHIVHLKHFLLPPSSSHTDSDDDMIADALSSYYGSVLVTSSFDGTIKLWGHGDYKPLKTLAGHQGKVYAVDVSRDGYVASVASDRTLKVWFAET